MFVIVGAHGLNEMGLVGGDRRAGAEGTWQYIRTLVNNNLKNSFCIWSV